MPAELYIDAAGFDAIKGLEDIEKDESAGKDISFNIVDEFLRKTWSLSISTGAGRKGSLTLPMPESMTMYKADHHTGEGPEPVLYKEIIFNGKVADANGIFRSSTIKPAAYTLIFQGRGNLCDEASNFTHWRLKVKGPRADYAFFGKLKQ